MKNKKSISIIIMLSMLVVLTIIVVVPHPPGIRLSGSERTLPDEERASANPKNGDTTAPKLIVTVNNGTDDYFMRPGGRPLPIAIRVTNDTGSEVDNVLVSLFSDSGGYFNPQTYRSGRYGWSESIFFAPNVTTRSTCNISAHVTKEGYSDGYGYVNITLIPSLYVTISSAEQIVEVGKNTTILIYVTNGMSAVSNSTVTLTSNFGTFYPPNWTTDEKGTFTTVLDASSTTTSDFCKIAAETTKSGHADGHGYVEISVRKGMLVSFKPTSIVGNSQLTVENGVINPTAVGTENDPYIIEGWYIIGTGDTVIQDIDKYLTIQKCHIRDGKIVLRNATHIRINNITTRDIYIQDSYSSNISIERCNLSSLFIEQSSNIAITNCTFNAFSDDNAYGTYVCIYILSSQNISISFSNFSSTDKVIRTSGAICVRLNYCNFWGGTYGVEAYPSGPELYLKEPESFRLYEVDARYCWWGSPNGPSDVGNGSGLKVGKNVRFSPWLTDPTTLNLSSNESEVMKGPENKWFIPGFDIFPILLSLSAVLSMQLVRKKLNKI